MKSFLLSICILMAGITSQLSFAASQNECAIWLCLPAGFPSGCGDAKSAMRDRVKHFKSPLPSFSSCAVNPPSGSGSHMESKDGIAAYIPAHQVCSQYRWSGGKNGSRYCVAYETMPEQYVRGVACTENKEGDRRPALCTATFRWAEVYVDGRLAGPTHYWR